MRVKAICVAVLLGAISMVAHADARWCSISSLGPGQNLIYPPIARAARVSGHVMERVIYSPGKGATSFEFISGPGMLSKGLEDQMRRWTISTVATGDAPCMTLVIADFKLDERSGDSTAQPMDVSVSSIVHMQVSTAPLIISDPAIDATTKASWPYRIGYSVRNGFRKVFGVRQYH